MPISQNAALFSLIGTQFGGDGKTNFNLPDLRERFVMGAKQPSEVGQTGGSSLFQGNATGTIALAAENIPAHTHTAAFAGAAGTQTATLSIAARQVPGVPVPQDGYLLGQGSQAGGGAANIYVDPGQGGTSVQLGGGSVEFLSTPSGTVEVQTTGEGEPLQLNLPVSSAQQILPPWTKLVYVIALVGIFPQPSD